MTFLAVLAAVSSAFGADRPPDEHLTEREAVFDFAQRPTISRDGARYRIRFTTKGACDVAVAVEDATGRIVRYLACGVLGRNAPAPLQRGSKKQTLVWDGKNDDGRYIDEPGRCSVRVSLGLKAAFERALFWEPKKRMAPTAPLLAARPEGVYVYEGFALDHLRLFDHKGEYVRTIYPFPADKVGHIVGLSKRGAPELGREVLLKHGSRDETLLTSGPNGRPSDEDTSDEYKSHLSHAASALAVRGDRIAMPYYTLTRLATDGASPQAGTAASRRLDLNGPRVEVVLPPRKFFGKLIPRRYYPGDAAFSPDGKWVYLTAYHMFYQPKSASQRWSEFLHGVTRVAFEGTKKPVPFKGKLTLDGAAADNDHLDTPMSVACDAKGNVYVADYLNDRVQVFGPDGGFLTGVKVHRPVVVRVSPTTGEIYVFSWILPIRAMLRGRKVEPTLTVFAPLEKPVKRVAYRLPFIETGPYYSGFHMGTDRDYWAEVDFWTDPPTIWFGIGLQQGDWGRGEYGQATSKAGRRRVDAWRRGGLKLLVPKAGKLVVARDFAADALRSVRRLRPPRRHAQHLFVNPRTGKLYVLEFLGKGSGLDGLDELVEIDPATGAVKLVKLPFVFEDLAFGPDGLAYFQLGDVVMRYDLAKRREVPWDYGESRTVGLYKVVAGLSLKGFASWHHWAGKMSVSAKGHIAISARGGARANSAGPGDAGVPEADAWRPRIFPGRAIGEYVHVWDKHGRVVYEDAIAGLGNWSVGAVGMYRDDDLLLLLNSRYYARGTDRHRLKTGVLMRFSPNKARILTGSPKVRVPLPPADRPKRPAEMHLGWVENVQWMRGGVGFNTRRLHCGCWHTSMALDYFGRAFVPRPHIYRIAVVDAAGNLILRVGRYGNADSAGPRSRVPLGGDETGLFTPNYVAAHTDARLFIADAGNGRIVGVRLGYHCTERVKLPSDAGGR